MPKYEYKIAEAKDIYTVDVEDTVFKNDFMGIEITCIAKNNGSEDISFANPGLFSLIRMIPLSAFVME